LVIAKLNNFDHLVVSQYLSHIIVAWEKAKHKYIFLKP